MDYYKIELNDEQYALISESSLEKIKDITWSVDQPGYVTYPGKRLRMHRVVLDLKYKDGKVADHINRNRLDNRLENLRVVTSRQNSQNTGKTDKKKCSQYKGVTWREARSRWLARIYIDGKAKQVGSFITEEMAAKAYDKAAKEHFGEYACLNFPEVKENKEGKCLGIVTRKDLGYKISKTPGVSKHGPKYRSSYGSTYLGLFKTEEEALAAREACRKTYKKTKNKTKK